MGLRYPPTEPSTQPLSLDNSREERMNVPQSPAGGNLTAQPGAYQHGNNSRQYNSYGEEGQRIVDGCYFEANGNQNFDMVLPNISMKSSEVR
ncbi:hypothetical protein BDV35DRAFT_399159 [Aspergillus flavus]|uniref:Uncharacterized protein n=1 Tax=Aspergillus flavus TaxID=5059 RepID=A0A5N6GBX7_ASPFL|nr:hypothetical protein BDV35DRAFT_399159 [Aspergillus flavus]